jgi:carnitine O-acetyltransferase
VENPDGSPRFDDSGKISLDHIYGQADPRAYYKVLRQLGYCIPENAKPFFGRLIQEHQDEFGRAPTVLDVGCSYGINAALLRCDATEEELHDRYCATPRPSREAMLARDRELVHHRGREGWARFVGLDASRPALSYAHAAGFLDDALHADLESRDLTPAERRRLAGTDIVISTGCVGYITERTIVRVAAAAAGADLTWPGPDRPARSGHPDGRWPVMAHFVLRMFPFDPVATALAGLGYETVRLDRVFKQRRFASAEEKTLVLDTMVTAGVDPSGLESDGWLYAQLHISRPRGARPPLQRYLAATRETTLSLS